MCKATIWLMAIMLTVSLASANAQSPQKSVLIFRFPISASEKDPGIARTATLAFKEAMVQAGAEDALIFDAESPTVKRALLEKTLPDSITGSQVPVLDALKAGRVLGARFVMVGDADDDGKRIQLLMGDSLNEEVTSVGTLDMTDPVPEKIREQAREIAKQAWGRLSALVNQSVQPDVEKAAKAAVDAISMAQKYIDNGEHDQAYEELNKAIRLSPKDPEVRLAVGRFYLSQGKLANAIVELRTAVNLDPTQIVYRLWLADAYAQKQMYNEAEGEIKRGIQLNSSEPRLYAQLGKIYFLKGLLDDAVTQLTRSIELNRKDPDVHLLLGDTLAKKGRTSQAINAYLEASRLRPEDSSIYQRLSAAYASLGMLAESLSTSLQALKGSRFTDAEKYREATRIADDHVRGLLAKFQSDLRVFQNGAMGNGDFGQACKVLADRCNSLIKFLEGFTPPADLEAAHKQRILGLSLLSEGATKELSAVETNNDEQYEEARLLFMQAQRELAQVRNGSSAITLPAKTKEDSSN